MAVRTVTVTVTQTANGPTGPGGSLEFDELDAREGTPTGVSYQVTLSVTTTGGLASDESPALGSAMTSFDLDPGDHDGVALDAFVSAEEDLPPSRSSPAAWARP